MTSNKQTKVVNRSCEIDTQLCPTPTPRCLLQKLNWAKVCSCIPSGLASEQTDVNKRQAGFGHLGKEPGGGHPLPRMKAADMEHRSSILAGWIILAAKCIIARNQPDPQRHHLLLNAESSQQYPIRNANLTHLIRFESQAGDFYTGDRLTEILNFCTTIFRPRKNRTVIYVALPVCFIFQVINMDAQCTHVPNSFWVHLSMQG